MTAVATFMPTVGQAREAGFFPSRHTVEIVDNRMLADGVYRLTFRDDMPSRRSSSTCIPTIRAD